MLGNCPSEHRVREVGAGLVNQVEEHLQIWKLAVVLGVVRELAGEIL
jgi:hypothetical protein